MSLNMNLSETIPNLRQPLSSHHDLHMKTFNSMNERFSLNISITQIGAGLDVSDNSTFGEYAALWLRVYKVPYLRQNSLLAIENALNNHIYPYLRDVPLKKVNQIQIQLVIVSVSKMSRSLNIAGCCAICTRIKELAKCFFSKYLFNPSFAEASERNRKLRNSDESAWKEAQIIRCRSSAHPFTSGETAGYHLSGDH